MPYSYLFSQTHSIHTSLPHIPPNEPTTLPLPLLQHPSPRPRTLDVARVGVEAHQLDGLVVAAGGDQVADRAPGQAVDGALVVLGALKQHRRLVGDVVISATRRGGSGHDRKYGGVRGI